MLIKIDKTIVEKLSDYSFSIDEVENQKIIYSLNNIAIACIENSHLVSASLEVLEFLSQLESLDIRSRRLYNSLKQRFSMIGSYDSLFRYYVVVKNVNKIEKSTIESSGQVIYEVPYSYFEKTSSIQSSKMLSEDLSDYKFYLNFANKYLRENREKYNMSLSFDFVNGGGDNSANAYEDMLKSNKVFSLAIIDSDMKYPESPLGETGRKLARKHDIHKIDYVTELLILKVREKENLIPPSLYQYIVNNSVKKGLENLLCIENSDYKERLRYLDLKDGLKLKHLNKDQRQLDYYKDMVEYVCGVESLNLLSSKEAENTVLIGGLGRSVNNVFNKDVFEENLKKKIETAQDSDRKQSLTELLKKSDSLFDQIPHYLRQDNIDLCEAIISWGCSETSFLPY